MEYRIVRSEGSDMNSVLKKLEVKVKLLCKEGWKPQGGISTSVTDFEWYYACQAMVK